MIKDKQIEEALKNIADLKEALNNNLADISPAIVNKSFAKSLLINNLLFTFATIITFIATYKYGTILKAPIIYGASTTVIVIVALVYIFTRKIKALKTSKENSLRKLLKHKAFSRLYFNVLVSIFVALVLFLAIQFQFDGMVNTNWTLLPLLILSYGVSVIISGNALFIKELSISGYFIIILSLITFFLYRGSALLWTLIDLTIIFYILYFAIKASLKRSN
jgi:hypothetical protein